MTRRKVPKFNYHYDDNELIYNSASIFLDKNKKIDDDESSKTQMHTITIENDYQAPIVIPKYKIEIIQTKYQIIKVIDKNTNLELKSGAMVKKDTPIMITVRSTLEGTYISGNIVINNENCNVVDKEYVVTSNTTITATMASKAIILYDVFIKNTDKNQIIEVDMGGVKHTDNFRAEKDTPYTIMIKLRSNIKDPNSIKLGTLIINNEDIHQGFTSGKLTKDMTISATLSSVINNFVDLSYYGKKHNSNYKTITSLPDNQLNYLRSGLKVDKMNNFMDGCSKLESLPKLDGIDTSNVDNMKELFHKCESLKSLDISNFNTSKVTDMGDMFYECHKLTSLDVSNFDTSKVTNMYGTFYECKSLKSLDVSHFDTSKVTNMNSMFDECNNLTSLDVSHFDTSKVTDMGAMFAFCHKLTSLDVSHFDTSKVTDMHFMFCWCDHLTSLDVSHFDTSKVTNMGSMFSGCAALESLNISNFNTSNVTSMRSMFSNMDKITQLDVSNLDTSKVTDMSSMFDSDESLKSLDLSNFNTSKVTDMSTMFHWCHNLTSLNVSHFDTSKVTNMFFMFVDCNSMKSLDLSSFDTSNVTDMEALLDQCKSLTIIDISNFDTSKTVNTKEMFGWVDEESGTNRYDPLEYIILNSNEVKFIPRDDMLINKTCKILIPKDAIPKYLNKYEWKKYEPQIDAIENYDIIKPGDGTVQVKKK